MPRKMIIWHYTYDHHILEILESKVLLPPSMTPNFADQTAYLIRRFGPESVKYLAADTKLLMFSQRADWEPASFRTITVGGQVIALHKLEDYGAYGKRVFRIGVSRDLLHPWMRLKRLCGMSPELGKRIEQVARRLGSNPLEWWGTLKPVPSEQWRAVEIYQPESQTWDDFGEVVSKATPCPPKNGGSL